MRIRPDLIAGSLAILWATTAAAQPVISAQTALVVHLEGKVLLTHRPGRPKSSFFHKLLDRDVLDTESGRAEIVLTPGALLRLDEHSSMRLLSGRITDSHVELLKGRFVLEASQVNRGESLTLTCRGATIAITKPGLYRVDADQAGVRVFGGQVSVLRDGRRVTVGKGKALPLEGTGPAGKFDRQQADAFDLWSRHRSQLMVMAAAVADRGALGGWTPADQPMAFQSSGIVLSK